MRRRVAALAAAALLAATVASCTDEDPPEQRRPPGTAPTHGRPTPTPVTPVPPEPVRLADAQLRVGPAEIVMGPSTSVDSPLNAIKVGDTVRAYVGNVATVLLEGSSVADLVPTDRVVVGRGDETAFDWCGAWLDAVEPDQDDPDLLRAWYHAESDCAYGADQTHKSIAYAESRDGGLTFTKPGYPDNQVVRSPTGGTDGHHTGRGEPSVVRRGGHFYMYYRNVLPDLSTVTSVARAPVASGGVPGSWRSWTGSGWEAPALDGAAAALETTFPASSVSLHNPSDEVVLVRQHGPGNGIVLQASAGGLRFDELRDPLVPFLRSQVREDWSIADHRQIFGYTSLVAPDGSRKWSDEVYLFHMYVFPGDELRGGRYLVRRRVVVDHAPDHGPGAVIALASYTSGADTFATSAPLEPGPALVGVTASLLTTPGPDRAPLFECTATDGDRYVGAGCPGARQGRLVGYAATAEQPGTVLLVACEDAGDGYPALASDCAAPGVELGWVYPPD